MPLGTLSLRKMQNNIHVVAFLIVLQEVSVYTEIDFLSHSIPNQALVSSARFRYVLLKLWIHNSECNYVTRLVVTVACFFIHSWEVD